MINLSDAFVHRDMLYSVFEGPELCVRLFFMVTGSSAERFQPADRLERQKFSDQTDNNYMEIQPMWTTRDVSMKVHSGFR